MQLGKIAIERPGVAALNEELALAAENERTKAVPFRLVQIIARRYGVGELGEHRLDRRRDGI
jgi:hypothetical protein